MSRLAALVRAWLDVPSRAEVMPRLRETRVVVTALASERAACHDPSTSLLAMNEAMAHATRVCTDYMACRPLEEPQRPLVPMEPAPAPAAPPPGFVALALAAALAVLFAGLLSMRPGGCTIRGGESCSDTGGCVDLRRPDAAVPAPGGPL